MVRFRRSRPNGYSVRFRRSRGFRRSRSRPNGSGEVLCVSGEVLCVSGEVVCSCSMFLFDDLSLSSRRKELFCLSRKWTEFFMYFGAEFLMYLKQSFRLCFLFRWEFPFRVQIDLLESVWFSYLFFWSWARSAGPVPGRSRVSDSVSSSGGSFRSEFRSIYWTRTKTYCVDRSAGPVSGRKRIALVENVFYGHGPVLLQYY
jgi:hypothetical protein